MRAYFYQQHDTILFPPMLVKTLFCLLWLTGADVREKMQYLALRMSGKISNKNGYNNAMTHTYSPWRPRIEELVNLFIAQGIFKSDVPTGTVEQALNYWVGCKAKQLDSVYQKCPSENPWLASVMLYVCLGDYHPTAPYSEETKLQAGVFIGMAERGGWTCRDVLQVVEWVRNIMPYHPTPDQWSSIFNIEYNEVETAQTLLVPNMVDLLNPEEKSVWNAATNLDAPFYYWTAQLNKKEPAQTLSLPALDMDI